MRIRKDPPGGRRPQGRSDSSHRRVLRLQGREGLLQADFGVRREHVSEHQGRGDRFAPVFVTPFVTPFVTLGVDPTAVLSAYRVGDSPTNAITPLNACFWLVVGFAQLYDKKAGIGTIVALLLPYAIWMTVAWMGLFAAWYLLGLYWGV